MAQLRRLVLGGGGVTGKHPWRAQVPSFCRTEMPYLLLRCLLLRVAFLVVIFCGLAVEGSTVPGSAEPLGPPPRRTQRFPASGPEKPTQVHARSHPRICLLLQCVVTIFAHTACISALLL